MTFVPEVSDRLFAVAGLFEKYTDTGCRLTAEDVRMLRVELLACATHSRRNETAARSVRGALAAPAAPQPGMPPRFAWVGP